MDLSFSEFTKGEKWGILPEAFEEMFSRLNAAGAADGIQAAAAQFGNQQRNDLYSIDNGVAVIPITGPIMKRDSFLSFFFGGTSYAYIRAAVRTAIEDSAVEAIVLRIDSPGGVVNGVEETGDVIFNARGIKPIISFNDGQMMSAAYWIGSAADKIISNKTAGAGSIGVLMVHADWSRWNEQQGIKYTYLTAGKYKALGNPDEPLSETAKEVFQGELNYLYSIFVGTVARNRDVEEDQVLSKMADGKVFIGQQSMDAGLVDEISDLKTAVEAAREMAGAASRQSRRRTIMKIENVEQLRTEYPELVKQIEDNARAGVDLKTVETQAAAAENSRIVGLAKIQFGEEEGEKFANVVKSGVSVEQLKAVTAINGKREVAAQKSDEQESIESAKAETLEAIKAAGPANPGSDGNLKTAKQTYMQAVDEYQREKKCSRFVAMQEINRRNPQLRQDYIKAINQ